MLFEMERAADHLLKARVVPRELGHRKFRSWNLQLRPHLLDPVEQRPLVSEFTGEQNDAGGILRLRANPHAD